MLSWKTCTVITLGLAAVWSCALSGEAQSPSSVAKSQPVELGKVSWLRKYDAATAASAKSGKPVLILFQEVPG